MSHVRQQGFIDAPVQRIWELLANVERHPEWWPRVEAVRCEGLDEGCTYREVVRTPVGTQEMNLLIEQRNECRDLAIRCLNTGTFVRMQLTEAQGGTFVDGEMGMDAKGLSNKAFDRIAGRRYFTAWMAQTFDALEEAAQSSEPALP